MKGFQGQTEDTAGSAEDAGGTETAGTAKGAPDPVPKRAGSATATASGQRVETAMAQGPVGRKAGDKARSGTATRTRTRSRGAGSTAKAGSRTRTGASARPAAGGSAKAQAGPVEPAGGGRSAGEVLRRFGYFLLRAVAVLAAFAAMVAFAVVLAQLTLTPMPGAVEQTHTNLQPGWSLRHYLDAPAREALQQVGGNIALGVPFGVLLPTLFPGSRSVLRTVLMAGVAMLLVEVVQGSLITGRAFDIDDVILNTTGALLGFLFLGRRMSRAIHDLGKD